MVLPCTSGQEIQPTMPVDGTIYVTAQYGGSGNLYTVKNTAILYFAFEFAFMCESVSNGGHSHSDGGGRSI